MSNDPVPLLMRHHVEELEAQFGCSFGTTGALPHPSGPPRHPLDNYLGFRNLLHFDDWQFRLAALVTHAYGFGSETTDVDTVIRTLVNDFLGPGILPPVDTRPFTYYEQLVAMEENLMEEEQLDSFRGLRVQPTVHARIFLVYNTFVPEDEVGEIIRYANPQHSLAEVVTLAANKFGVWNPHQRGFGSLVGNVPFDTAIARLVELEKLHHFPRYPKVWRQCNFWTRLQHLPLRVKSRTKNLTNTAASEEDVLLGNRMKNVLSLLGELESGRVPHRERIVDGEWVLGP